MGVSKPANNGAAPVAGAERDEERGVQDEQDRDIAQLPRAVEQLSSDDIAEQIIGATFIRRALSKGNAERPIRALRNQPSAIPRVIALLRQSADERLLHECVWILTNIAGGSNDDVRAVVDAGALDLLLSLLGSRNIDLAEQTVWLCGNIAGDCVELRDELLRMDGVYEKLIELMGPEYDRRVALQRQVAWTLSNLARGRPQPDFERVRIAVPALVSRLSPARYAVWQDTETINSVVWCLAYTSDDKSPDNNKLTWLLANAPDMLQNLLPLMSHESHQVRSPVLHVLGNVASGDEYHTQALIDSGALGPLRALLSDPKDVIRKETCWCLSNITAGSRPQVQAVLDAGILPPLLDVLEHSSMAVQREAMWAVGNALNGGSNEQVRWMTREHPVVVAVSRMIHRNGDARMLGVVLEALGSLLRVGAADAPGHANPVAQTLDECGALDELEGLQMHASNEVADAARELIERYFEFEEDGAAAGNADGGNGENENENDNTPQPAAAGENENDEAVVGRMAGLGLGGKQ